MADSAVFERTCEELLGRTSLDRLAARGTVRIALKSAGLDPTSVDREQMSVALRRVLPRELANRGIDDAERVCNAIADLIDGLDFEAVYDRAGAAASTIGRFGS